MAKYPNLKQVVVGIKQRDGELRFFHAEDAKKGTLAKYIRENISQDVEVIMTDELPAYPGAIVKAGMRGVPQKPSTTGRRFTSMAT